ncbi:MAG: hypothetical protein WCK10_03445 [Candidatus Staskawiczbacteria bacterium]
MKNLKISHNQLYVFAILLIVAFGAMSSFRKSADTLGAKNGGIGNITQKQKSISSSKKTQETLADKDVATYKESITFDNPIKFPSLMVRTKVLTPLTPTPVTEVPASGC